MTFTLNQVMTALAEAISHQPLTSRDCDLEKRFSDNLKDLAHRTRKTLSEENRVAAADDGNGG